MEYFLNSNVLLLAMAENLVKVRGISVHFINQLRKTEGEFHLLFPRLLEDHDRFHSYMRMTPTCFNYIVEKLKERPSTNFIICPINNKERLMVTLRFLSTGQSFHALAFSFRMGVSTVREIVYDTCEEIWEIFSSIHLALPTREEFVEIAKEFENRWQYPNCLGCIDGKHIRIKNPQKAGSMYFNYRKFFSIVLQAVVDAKYRFICIEVGAYGHQHDAGTFRQSMFNNVVIQNQMSIPDPKPLPGTLVPIPYVFLADEAYPLLINMMRPYLKASLNDETKYYNDRHSRARKTVECAFGITANKWRLLWKPIEVDPKKGDGIVKCICLLHNIVLDIDGPPQNVERFMNNNIRQRNNLHNRPENLALRIRNAFKDYFCNNIVV